MSITPKRQFSIIDIISTIMMVTMILAFFYYLKNISHKYEIYLTNELNNKQEDLKLSEKDYCIKHYKNDSVFYLPSYCLKHFK